MNGNPLAMLPLDRGCQEICDWFELYTLSSEYFAVSIHELSRAWDKRKNSEDADFEGNSEGNTINAQEFQEDICQEIRNRIEKLGDCYPFQFGETDEELVFQWDSSNEGAIIYVFCLFVSNTNNDVIFDDASFYTITHHIRDLFQACATWAAASLVLGHSYSFGFPRPDHSGFLQKLTTIYKRFGDGQVRKTPLPGVSSNQKDAKIDIISWHPRVDSAPGTHYILGQVATGNGWPEKNIKGAPISAFHEIWFELVPASTPTPAMFIPFNIIPENNESIAEKVGILTRQLGDIYYRLVMPKLAQKGLELARINNNLVIERIDDIAEVSTWVEKVIQDFRSACVYF